jgi:anti-sigma factor RsiW
MATDIDEASLHAYVDGQLDAVARAQIEALLRANPEAAARAQAYAAINADLHRLFDPVLEEPHAIGAGASHAAGAGRWGSRRQIAAALVAALGIGAVLGYAARGMIPASADRRAAGLAQQVVVAHAAYRPEVRHPVEVGAAEEAHLVAWLSKRLAVPLRAPSLAEAGFHLLGGRLLPAAVDAAAGGPEEPTPVALLMYENARGQRLSLMIRREPSHRDTAFRFAQQGATGVFYWIDGPLGYALAAELPREELAAISRLVYRQLNP